MQSNTHFFKQFPDFMYEKTSPIILLRTLQISSAAYEYFDRVNVHPANQPWKHKWGNKKRSMMLKTG